MKSLLPILRLSRKLFTTNSVPSFFKTKPTINIKVSDLEGEQKALDSYNKVINHISKFNSGYKLSFDFLGDVPQSSSDYSCYRMVLSLDDSVIKPEINIIGNRDINQVMRYYLLSHAPDSYVKKQLLEGKGAFFSPKSPLAFVQDFYKLTTPEAKNFIENCSAIDRKIIYCRYIQTCEMGCPNSFEARRVEIAKQRDKKVEDISDEDVLNSFCSAALDSQSLQRQYFEGKNPAQLLHIAGNHLYVHGALNKDCIGFIPGKGKTNLDLPGWVQELNAWFYDSYHKTLQSVPDYSKMDSLLSEIEEADIGKPTFPMSNSMIVNKEFKHLDKEVIDYLTQAGINIVHSGHTPPGNCPIPYIIKHPGNVVTVCHDTSRSGYEVNMETRNNGYSKRDNSCVLVYTSSDKPNKLFVYGELDNGRLIDYSVSIDEPNSPLGLLRQGWLGTMVVEYTLIVRKLNGFKMMYHCIPKNKIEDFINNDYRFPEFSDAEIFDKLEDAIVNAENKAGLLANIKLSPPT